MHKGHQPRSQQTDHIEQSSADNAVRNSHLSVGCALLFTSFIITLGFSLLSFSDFVPSILFGLLTGFAMITALMLDLTLLPAMLHRFDKPSATSAPSP